jgi:hypothetical protein
MRITYGFLKSNVDLIRRVGWVDLDMRSLLLWTGKLREISIFEKETSTMNNNFARNVMTAPKTVIKRIAEFERLRITFKVCMHACSFSQSLVRSSLAWFLHA